MEEKKILIQGRPGRPVGATMGPTLTADKNYCMKSKL